jgi:hypothetical protein
MASKTQLVEDDWTPDPAKLKGGGQIKTQSLFLEMGYDTEEAIYTLKDSDHEHKGKIYPSLRRLYLEAEDPTEYNFAEKYLWGWDQWQKMVDNKALYEHIRLWRDELEVKMRAVGVRDIIGLSKGSFTAAKWVADGHWNVKRGRPSKDEVERERKIRQRAVDEVSSDSDRVVAFRKG